MLEALLEKRGWSLPRIARTIGSPLEYVQRVQSGQQSFQVSDVEALAEACGQQPYELIFAAVRRNDLSAKGQQLYDRTVAEIARYQEFQKALQPKPVKKRGHRSK